MSILRNIVSILMIVCLGAFTASATESSDLIKQENLSIGNDSISCAATDSIRCRDKDNPNFWINRIKQRNLDMKDSTVIYPRFIQFCVDVYNWGDRTFNSYDDNYVEGTGHKWKAMVRSDDWSDSYAMNFNHKMPVWMLSDVYYNAGFYVSYMAVSIGYTLDLSHIIGNRPALHKKLDFNFTCARFTLDAYYSENTGGTVIRSFGDYNNGHVCKVQFPGVKFRSYGADLYYFLNNRKYSQGAVYNFSKIQKKSAGSVIVGLTYSNHKVDIDFNHLPDILEPYYTLDNRKYKFHYNDYCFLIGYGHNFVVGKHVIFNVSALPSVGYKRSRPDCVGGMSTLFSMNYKGKVGMVYNIGDFFLGVSAKIDGHWFLNSQYSLFSSIINFGATAGVRF